MATAPRPAGALDEGAAVGLLKMGYPLEIFAHSKDRDKYMCGLCAMILREPVQADCGHLFCENCRKAVEEAGQRAHCRFCLVEGCPPEECKLIPHRMKPDKGILREMAKITATCPNETCTFSGPFHEFIKHEQECEFQLLICDKCGQSVSKRKMDNHKSQECSQRIIICEHCQEELPLPEKTSHSNKCPKVPENCSMCNQLVPREKMKRHQSSDCPNRTVLCPLEDCAPAQQNPMEYQQHVRKEVAKHLAWVVTRMNDLHASIAELTAPSTPSGACEDTPPPPSVAERVADLRERVDAVECELQKRIRAAAVGGRGHGGSGGSSTGGTPVVAGRDPVAAGGAPVAAGGAPVAGPVAAGDPGGGGGGGGGGGAEASTSTSGGSSDEQRIQCMDRKVDSLEPLLGILFAELSRCVHAVETVQDRLQRESPRMHDSQQRIAVSQPAIARMSSTADEQEAKIQQLQERVFDAGQDEVDGTLVWKIPNFSQVHSEAMSGACTNLLSRPFYTGPIGYKLAASLYPDGEGAGKGTHLSLFLCILRSPHDALLPWPFQLKVHFMVLDQTLQRHEVGSFQPPANDPCFKRPVSEMNQGAGLATFMPLHKLHSRDYLKDDTLYIRVVVDTQGLVDHVKQFDAP